jgi:uncharacterized membrane protein
MDGLLLSWIDTDQAGVIGMATGTLLVLAIVFMIYKRVDSQR